jgi:DNA-binding IclR family transcriptional regulator
MTNRQVHGVRNIAFPVLDNASHALAALNIPYIERIDKKVTPSIAAAAAIDGARVS